MKIRSCAIFATLFAAALMLTACGDYVGKEKTHPLFVKAGTCRAAENYEEAAKYYEEFLYVCPRSPLAHYELATLYSDNLEDPIRAISHYQKYLDLSGANADPEGEIAKFIDSCRKRAFDQLSTQYNSTETERAIAEAQKSKDMLQKYVKYAEQLKAQNDELRKRLSSSVKTTTSKTAPVKNTNVKTGTAAAQQTQAGLPDKTGRYTVKQGDTLSKISKAMYGSAKYYNLILKANESTVGPKGNLKVGQVLVIPQLP